MAAYCHINILCIPNHCCANTNYFPIHVKNCSARIFTVRIENDSACYRTSQVIKYNALLDLAVIRIDRALVPLSVYKGPQKLVRGQKVVAIGSPLGLFNSVSDGIISGFRKMDDVDLIHCLVCSKYIIIPLFIQQKQNILSNINRFLI